MPFSRYQIRNEFSLADPELYKSADKDDPEALLEGVAMAGLVGVLRQLGDLAEFAAEIFHGLHEEVMVTAARGHDLLVRVQQVESDFPSIERAFLSQTGHSAFFSSSGISWHPNLQTEQNLITKGDLPRFVMDSYEESRGPPRLFLLDKFDVAGAGACLKRYTDPSFYKVEASSYEMMSAEAQRDKKIRKTKKKGSRLKNGETPDVFQPSHVKLHQLLLEERVQNGASEPARRVKLKKREIKFPFDTENGKGYMEKLLSSPPEDKLVHEVPVGYSELEPLEDRMVNSPMQNGSPYEAPTVDKTVSREHMDTVLENSSIELQPDDIEDKHISVDVEQKEVGFEDGYRSDDVASETENFMDALTTMESEVETDVELRVAISDPVAKQEIEPIQSQFSDSQSASDNESSLIMNKITSFSYSDTTSTSPENVSPHGINSSAFASTEIPFRPRVSPNEVSDNFIEARDNESLPVDNGAIIEESTSKESDSREILSNNRVDVDSHTRKEEIEIDPEYIIASIVDNEDYNSNSSIVIHDVLEGNSEQAEANVSYSSEDETELKDREIVSFDSKESKVAMTDDKQELKEIEPESVNSEAKDSVLVSVPDDVDSNGIQDLSTCEDIESKGREIETVDLEKNEDNGVSTTEELGDKGPVINESGAGLNSGDSVEKESSDHPNMQILDSIFKSFSVTDNDLNENDDNDEIKSLNQVDQIDQLETRVDQFESVDSQNHLVDTHSDSEPIDHESYSLEQGEKFQNHEEPSIADLSQPSTHINRSGFNMIPPLAPNNMEKMPPLPPLPPMQWRTGKLPSDSLFSNLGGGQHDFLHQFPPASLDLNENATNEKSEHDVKDLSSEEDENLVVSLPGGGQHGNHQFPPASQIQNEINTDGKLERDYEDSNTEEVGKLDVPTEVNTVKFEENIVSQPPQYDNKTDEKSEHDYEGLNTEEDGKLDVSTEMNVVKFAENIVPQAPQYDNKTDEKSEHDYEDLNTEEDGKLDVPTEVNAVEFEEKIVPQPPQNDNKTDEKSEHDYEDLNTEEDGKLDVLTEVNDVKFEEIVVPQPPQNDNNTDEKSKHDYEDLNTEEDGKLDVPTEVNAVKFEEKIVPQPPQNDDKTDKKSEHDFEDLNTDEDGKFDVPMEVNVVKSEENIVPQPPQYREQSENVLNSGPEIIRPLSTSVLPPIDNEKPNGIRPMRIQRPRSPLIDAVAAHDKSKLKKASERAMPPVPKEEERDTLLEQIRAKSFNLKPAVQTRPSIQGPSTNLRVAAILEKANAIRQAFAGSDDDEDDSDSWSDS